MEHAKAAVERSGKETYIAGSLGPSPGAIEADSGDTTFGIANHLVRDAHRRLADALAEGGVDFFCIETMFSAREASMVVDVARQYGLPVAVNLTYKYTRDRDSGKVTYRTDWGHSAPDLLEIFSAGELSGGDNLLEHVDLLGLNCGAEPRREEHTGMPYAIQGVRELREAMVSRQMEPKRMMAYPNAGMPQLDDDLRSYYTQTPEEIGRPSARPPEGRSLLHRRLLRHHPGPYPGLSVPRWMLPIGRASGTYLEPTSQTGRYPRRGD